jgi:hypothetical protein
MPEAADPEGERASEVDYVIEGRAREPPDPARVLTQS